MLILLIMECFSSFALSKLIPFEKNGKFGFINEKFEVISMPLYSTIFNNGKYYFGIVKGNKNNIVEESNIIFLMEQ